MYYFFPSILFQPFTQSVWCKTHKATSSTNEETWSTQNMISSNQLIKPNSHGQMKRCVYMCAPFSPISFCASA